MAAAATYAFQDLVTNTVGLPSDQVFALDRDVVSSGESPFGASAIEHGDRVLTAMALVLNASVVDTNVAAEKCDERVAACRLGNATTLYTVGTPAIDGGLARISVVLTYRITRGDWPVLRTGYEVTLRRSDGVWEPVRAEIAWTT